MCSVQTYYHLRRSRPVLRRRRLTFICAFSNCKNYETNSDKNQNLNASSGIVIRPPPYVNLLARDPLPTGRTHSITQLF